MGKIWWAIDDEILIVEDGIPGAPGVDGIQGRPGMIGFF